MQIICEGHPQVVALSEGIQVKLYRPTILDEPVLQGETDADAAGVSIYGSVIRDGSVFRMWYQAWPKNWDGADVIAVGCVESDDGMNWRRPSYGLIECCGSTRNHLTDLPFHSTSVLIDPTAAPSARYRAFGSASPNRVRQYPQKINKPGYFTAHSADGLHWELDSPDPVWPWMDVITSVWDNYSGCARIALKHNLPIRRLSRRSFFTAEWARGKATQPVSALIPDEYDDLLSQAQGFNSTDYYGVGLLPTEGTTVGFLWNFRHQLPIAYYEPGMFHYGDVGRVDITIVYQTERGGRWQHVTGRPDWLSAQDMPDWARGALYTAAYPIDVGDETWLYFCGSLDRHGWCGKGISYAEFVKSAPEKGGWSRIGLAKWPKNRIIGYEAALTDYIVLSPLVVIAERTGAKVESKLSLNVVTRSGGQVRVQLINEDNRQPIAGYTFDDCQVITGDHLEATIRWKGKEGLPSLSSGPSMLAQIELTKATLYAFDFIL
ncbi:MAG: hypothetical protein CVU38_01815 [Chloroflexi bacterium HGW-Chloroflexi-1]|nr:MAG: hypothetical protein CVU38_01815 [Chloroflexi bacterium HGW-Chloroflexi-1]